MSDERPLPPSTNARRIGPYRLIRQLGEGGMGVVYLAEQKEPVTRNVALKLMHLTLRSDEARLRFQSERQALARLNLNAIARLYDAGTTEEGYPYFAMEAVNGEPVNAYCARHRLSLLHRLTLFQDICKGVQYAHQKGILHRDLKPSNVMITEENGIPVPKIIDFGVAKAIDDPLIDATLQTGKKLVGTPAYMSPETIQGMDVDSRTDVNPVGRMIDVI